MSVLPNTKSALLDFCSQHIKVWNLNAAAIGLTPSEIDVLENATEAATVTAAQVISTRDAAKSATLSDDNASRTMRLAAAALIAKIKATAEISSDPNIYVLAQIPEPAAPSPAAPPLQPVNVKPFLEPGGGLTIKWKTGTNAGTVTYNVYRKLPTQTTFSQIGTASGRTKKFTDQSLPVGSSGVQYFIQGWRGTSGGTPSEMLTVNFGTIDGDGVGGVGAAGFGYTLTPMKEPVKLAA
ncbi:MAG: hypothetical protein K2W85_14085 [Phycisphaerales bacterium]|nr:hypothetical protein [Phycisphaerales bacterium]